MGGHFYIGKQGGRAQLIYGTLIRLPSIMKHLMPLSADAEVGSIFIKSKEATNF
jgi:hypothetical protein